MALLKELFKISDVGTINISRLTALGRLFEHATRRRNQTHRRSHADLGRRCGHESAGAA